jgi:hypothetical protein
MVRIRVEYGDSSFVGELSKTIFMKEGKRPYEEISIDGMDKMLWLINRL